MIYYSNLNSHNIFSRIINKLNYSIIDFNLSTSLERDFNVSISSNINGL